MAAEQLPRVKVQVELRVGRAMPRELRVMFAPAGRPFDIDCEASELGTIACAGEVPARGESRVIATYRAVDGLLESVEQELHLHGDEEEIKLSGWFSDDASLRELTPRIFRAARPGVVLQAVEAPPTPGDLPSFVLTNGSDLDIEVLAQGHVLGFPVRLAEDDSWLAARRAFAGGCGTGVGPATLEPGMSAPAGEIYAIGGSFPFERGRYLYVVEYEDEETLGDEHVSRRVTVRFDVDEDLPAEFEAPGHDARSFALEYVEPDLWAGARAPARPGQARPTGREGSERADGAPLLADGDDIAGTLSPDRHRHTYRLQLQPNEEGVVRIFARCTASPCSASAGIFSGRGDDLGGGSSSLHREPPAWSVRDGLVQESHDTLSIGCLDECDEGWEFYGRVHIRAIPPEERY